MLPCSSITSRLPALWCSPSTFWVTRVSSEASSCISGDGQVARVGTALRATSLRRHAYQSQTSPGSRSESLRGRELLRIEAFPEPGLGLAEGRDAALGGDARSGKHDRAA